MTVDRTPSTDADSSGVAAWSPAERGDLASRLLGPSEWKMGWAPQLDGLRAVATIGVMLIHFLARFDRFVRGLVISVDLFFAMSGFLITTLLFAELERRGEISLRRFYIRRAVRLFPALYVLLGVFLVFAVLAGGEDRSHYLAEIAAAFLYVYNFFVAWVGVEGNALIQLWTLSIEAQFYLLWPLIFIRGTRLGLRPDQAARRLRLLVGAMVGFVVLWPALRMTLPRELGARTGASFLFGVSILRPDGVILGALAAFAMRSWGNRTSARVERRLSAFGTAALVVLVASVLLAPVDAFRPFVSPLANLAIICAAVFVFDLVRNPQKPIARLLSSKPLVWIGERSYAMYIWHLLIFFVLKGIIEGMLPGRTRLVELVTFPFAFAATILIAMASWRFIEQPAMRLKKRFNA